MGGGGGRKEKYWPQKNGMEGISPPPFFFFFNAARRREFAAALCSESGIERECILTESLHSGWQWGFRAMSLIVTLSATARRSPRQVDISIRPAGPDPSHHGIPSST